VVRGRFLALLAACLLQAGGVVADCKVGIIADLKATMQGSTPLVRVKINGAEVSMIADSGAFYSHLSQGTVTQFKLPNQMGNPYAYSTGIGGRQGIYITTVNTFTLADYPLKNVKFLITDNELGYGVAGLIGENVLGLKDAYYDLPDGLIRIVQPVGCGDRPFLLWDTSKPFSTVPLLPADGPFKAIFADAFVNGHRIKVELDTGASTSILSLEAARRAGVDLNGVGVRPGGVERGVGRRMPESWIVPVDSFKIGDEEIEHTRLRVADMALSRADMLLGADFFLSHRVYVANSQDRIYFTYVGGPVFNLAAAPQVAGGLTEPPTPGPDKSPEKPAADNSSAGTPEPVEADGFSRRGAAFAGRREFAPAIADLTRAIAMAPTEARYFTERAKIYLENRQPFLAMADLDQALKLKPDDTEALVTRARLRVSGREMAAAMADLDAADRLLPKEADERLQIAGLYDSAENGAAAAAQYSLWIKAHPEDNRLAQALNGRCWSRALWNIEADKAVADCDGAVRREPKIASFRDSRGLAHLRLGENDQAIADYDAALALQPKIPWSLYGRGIAKLRKGLKAEGQADLAAAAALAPSLPAEAAARGLDH
jgi:tetratricopeptide (TPR) repeat protein/predicted aspartyl protease